MIKKNVLIFPSGAENALEILDSLKYNIHFNLYGISSNDDHTAYSYPNYKIGEFNISDPNFISNFNAFIIEHDIDFIFPTHDSVALFLMENSSEIKSTIVCSPLSTTIIARSKKKTFSALKDCYFIPAIYDDIDKISEYPVFLKPDISSGGKGACIAYNNEDVTKNLALNKDLLISEFLPGDEFTVDCFTDSKGKLLFAGSRTRERITMGISFRSQPVELTEEFMKIAEALNNTFIFRGGWFFQVKRDKNGQLKLLEFSVRQAGTMALYRQLGINFAALSLFDFMDYSLEIIFNNYNIVLDRRLKNSYKLDYIYDKIYIDFDDTLIINDRINTTLIKLIYQAIFKKIKVILLTKHKNNIKKSFKKYKINPDIFYKIVLLKPDDNKSDYIDHNKSIFIDNQFIERKTVHEKCNIPVFDVDSIECLIDNTTI